MLERPYEAELDHPHEPEEKYCPHHDSAAAEVQEHVALLGESRSSRGRGQACVNGVT